MPVNPEQEAMLTDLAKGKTASQLRRIQAHFDQRGFDVQIGEYAPTSFAIERDEFKQGALEGLTFGAYEANERHPAAADFTIPGTDMEIGGANIAGNIAGGIPTAALGLGIGGAAARGLGVTGQIGRRVVQSAIGEAVPGGIGGLIRSGGDPDTALATAATFMAGGLMLEGTFTAVAKAINRMKRGAKSTADDIAAVTEYNALALKEGQPTLLLPERAGTDIGVGPAALPQGTSGTPLGLPAARVPTAEAMEATRRSVRDKLSDPIPLTGDPNPPRDPSIIDLPENAPIMPPQFVDDMERRLRREIFDRPTESGIPALNTMDQSASSIIENESVRRAAISDIIDEQLGQAGVANAHTMRVQAHISDMTNALADGVETGVINTDDAMTLLRRTYTSSPEEIAQFVAATNKQVTRVRNGLSDARVIHLTREAARDTKARVMPASQFSWASAINKTEGEFAEGFIHLRNGQGIPARITKDLAADGQARGMASFYDNNVPYTGQVKHIPLDEVESFQFLSASRGGGGAPEDELSDMASKMLASEQQKARIQDLREKMTRAEMNVQDFNVRHMTARQAREWLEANGQHYQRVHAQRMNKAGNDLYGKAPDYEGEGFLNSVTDWRDHKMPWLVRKLLPVTSRFSLGGNKATQRAVKMGLFHKEQIGADFGAFMGQYEDIMKRFTAGRSQQLRARFGDSESRQIIESLQQDRQILLDALDGNIEAIRGRQDLIPVHQELRALTNNLAEYMGIDAGKKISAYFPHVFNDRTGAFRANRLFEELGRNSSKLRAAGDIGNDELKRSQFFGTMDRMGKGGWEMDLDSGFYAYIRGATEKKHMDILNTEYTTLAATLKKASPDLYRDFMDWANYAFGKPTDSRRAIAGFFRDHERFQQGMNQLVAIVGDAGDKNLLNRAAAIRASGEVNHVDVLQARELFEKLVQDANRWTKEGRFNKVKGTDRFRAQLALGIDNLRAGMSNPNLAPPIISRLYELIVVNKLALSASHGLMNTTQTITNVIPFLGVRQVARGIKKSFGPGDEVFEQTGRTVNDIVAESGIEKDLPEAMEFFGGVRGAMKSVRDDVLMAPAVLSERFNRKVALLSSYEHHLKKGLGHEDALARSIDLVQKTHFPFNRFGTVPALRNPGIRLLAMFQSYALHQMNFTSELLVDAMKPGGDPAPLMKHIMAYAGLAGMGAMASGTSFGDKAEHPAMNILEGGVNVNTVGGPPAGALLDMLSGEFSSGVQTAFEPVAAARLGRATEAPSAGQAFLEATGFAR